MALINTTTDSSPPPSPQAPTPPLPALSRILSWNARRRQKTVTPQDDPEGSAVARASGPFKKSAKAHHIECSSGPDLKTHNRLVDCHPECRKSDVITHRDSFVCLDGVDTGRLLLFARRRVFEKVELLGGNAIIEERWSCIICKHETRRGTIYKVSVNYQGTPARCGLPDPQKPVSVDKAKGVPGLMTIVSRQSGMD